MPVFSFHYRKIKDSSVAKNSKTIMSQNVFDTGFLFDISGFILGNHALGVCFRELDLQGMHCGTLVLKYCYGLTEVLVFIGCSLLHQMLHG